MMNPFYFRFLTCALPHRALPGALCQLLLLCPIGNHDTSGPGVQLQLLQGVWERDEWRGNDSFESFSEVLGLAKTEAMDLVLLGGDLFHENKPSRNTLINCLQTMNKHCLGMEPVSFQVCMHSLATCAAALRNLTVLALVLKAET
jgi:hypothetical protein